MEENTWPENQPASTDLSASKSCYNELTGLNSDLSSLNHEDDASPVILGKCTAWTDEKHNSYLHHLEASFVKQLHQSRGLLAWCSKKNTGDSLLSQKLPAHVGNASKQFSVVRDGCWQKVNFERSHPLLDAATADSKIILKNPWISHFRCVDKVCTITSTEQQEHNTLSRRGMYLRGKRTLCDSLAASLEEVPASHSSHHDSLGSFTEVSDQNFVDEDKEERSNSLFMAKRLKTVFANPSSHDQIVPSRKFGTEISSDS